MATTTAPARASWAGAAPPAGTGVAPAAARPCPAAEAGAGRPGLSRAPYETGSSLLAPPDYDNIVGGVPPSPYASLISCWPACSACLISAVGAAAGAGHDPGVGDRRGC